MKISRRFSACLSACLLAACGPTDDQKIIAWRLGVEAMIANLDQNVTVMDRIRINSQIGHAPEYNRGSARGLALNKQQIALKCLALNRLDTMRDSNFVRDGGPKPLFYEEQDGVLSRAGAKLMTPDGRQFLDPARQARYEKALAEYEVKRLQYRQQSMIQRLYDEWTQTIIDDIRRERKFVDGVNPADLIEEVKSTLTSPAAVQKIVTEIGLVEGPK